MLFEEISIIALVAILFRGWNGLFTFNRGHYKEHICEIILNKEHVLVHEMLFKDKTSLQLLCPFFSREYRFVQFW